MALSSELEWEVRTTGNNLNGGAFKRGASGVDYSQQDSAQLSLTDCATASAGSTTLTSVTGGFTAAMIGNLINLSSGTNLTADWYEITGYTDANTVTIDRAPDDGVGGLSGVTGKVGGALAWPIAKPVARNKVWIKSGTYQLTSTVQGEAGGPVYMNSYGLSVEGYENTHGDLGEKPLFLADPNATYSNEIIYNRSQYGHGALRNLKVDCQNNTSNIYAIRTHDYRVDCYLLEATNCVNGIVTNGGYVRFCKVTNATGTGFGSSHTEFCVAGNIGGTAFNVYTSSAYHCIAYNCSTGFYMASQARSFRCIADNCSSIAFHQYANYGTTADCLATNSNIGFFNQYSNDVTLEYSWSYNNTTVRSGYVGSPAYDLLFNLIDTTSITVSPYVDAANGNYQLNNDPNGGKVVKDAWAKSGAGEIRKIFYPDPDTNSGKHPLSRF